MNKEKKIVAVVVTYNRKELLKKCLRCLLEQTYQKLDILVIDNASTDGTEEELRNFVKEGKIFYMNTGSNLGGAGGFSFGMNEAIKRGYDYLWIMDDDTMPLSDALEKLMDADSLLKGEFGFLSSYAKWTDGTACEMNVPRLSLTWRECIDRLDDHMIRLDAASFVSFLVKADVVRKVGLPIKEFFIWADDFEFSLRISKKFPCYFVYDSQVIHEMGANKATAIWEADVERLDRYKLLYRNRHYIAKQGAKADRFLYWISIKNVIRDTLKSNCTNKWKRCKIILASSLKGIFFNPPIQFPEKIVKDETGK